MLNLMVSPLEYNENGEKIAKKVVHYLKGEKVEYAVYFSPTIQDLEKNTLDLTTQGETEFVVIGNDLVLNSFINSVQDLSKIHLGIIPTSKHDDFASYLELNSNPIQAIKDILENNIEEIDYLTLNDMKVINNILVGASIEIFEVYNQYKMKNVITKQLAMMRYGNAFEGIELNIEMKAGKAKTENIFELSIANGGNSKGKPVSPLSNVRDGLFNFNYALIMEKNERKKYLNLFRKGNQIYNEATQQFWINSLKLTNPDNKIKALVDGKIMRLEELEIGMVEKGLKILKKKA